MDNKTNKHEFACNAGKVTEYEVKEHRELESYNKEREHL